ncbi:MAG: class I SAM-dependent methyltransferase [Planctomycetes bacterium]|nr:class I SAM-dependent methyltransferase [Planctomycetota bacterium]
MTSIPPGPVTPPTPYRRPPGYAAFYRDERFCSGTGSRTDRRERRAIAALLRGAPCAAGPWLDVPSGAGRLSGLLPGPVVQVDVDPAMLVACGAGSRRARASAHELPFADDAFAGALCMRLLQHLPTRAERVAVLAELRRVTRGPLIVSFFHAGSVQHLRRALRARLGRPRSGRSAIALRTMLADLHAAGLRAVAVRALAPLWSEQWLVRCERLPAAD